MKMDFPELPIDDSLSTTKFRSLVDAIRTAINEGKFKAGENLPSVNQISRQYHFSRDTVFKAFQELKSHGIIASTPAKSYHVVNEMNRVLLLLDVYSSFKEALFKELVTNLPKNFKVDLVFHFYNEHLFDTVINDSMGRYSNYVIMNFSNEQLHPSLQKIEPGKLLLLDLGDFDKKGYSFICQDFGQSVYDCLTSNINLVKKYLKLVLHLPSESKHPKILVKYFKKFVREYGLNGTVSKTSTLKNIEKNTVYFIIEQKNLVEIVKHCRKNGLVIGKDIGVVAYNDMQMYEIIENGITVISADFAEMGKATADFIKNRQKVNKFIPAQMIVRGSL
jgi:DNA-binding transcriptional regulator YhcF (GntR family)